jgi:Domain of Unknown Function (DUF748)
MVVLPSKTPKLSFRPPPEGRWRRRLKWTAIGIVAFVVLFALAGFFLVPVIAKSKLQQVLSAELGRPVTIERIEVNPFLPTARISGFRIGEPAGGQTMASFAKLEVDGSWRSITRRAPILAGVRLVDPYLKVTRLPDGRYSIQDLIDKALARPASNPPPSKEPPPRFAVANIELVNGKIEFDDRPKKEVHTVADLAIRVPFVSSLPVDQQIYVEPKIAAVINGTRFSADGKAHPFSPSRESMLQIDIGSFDLKRYLEYSPVALPVKVESAQASATATIEFAQPPDAKPTLTVRGQAKLSSVDVRERSGAPLLKLASVAVESMTLTPIEGRYRIGKVAIDAPEIVVHRGRDQPRFFESVLAAMAERPSPAAEPAVKSAAQPEASPLAWQIDQLVLSGGAVDFDDEQFSPKPLAVHAAPIAFELTNLSSEAAARAAYTVKLETAQHEIVAASGSVSINPVAVEGKASVEKVALKSWWWVIEPQVALDLVDGELSVAGEYRFAIEADAQKIDLSGWSAQLRNLAIRQRWDKAELIRIPALDVGGASVDLAGRKVVIGSLESNSGKVLLRRERDGRLNVARIAVSAPTGPAGAAPAARANAAPKESAEPAGWAFTLNKLLLDRYSASVEDQAAGKTADIRIDALRIAADGLTNESGKRGKLDLHARFNQTGSLQIAGPIGLNPLGARLRIDANRLSILPVQPYFTEYVNAIISNGLVSAKGDASIDLPNGKPPVVTYKGSFGIADFSAVTKSANEDLLRWKSLDLASIELALAPLKVDIAEVALDNFYSRLIINPQGRFNLQEVLVAKGGSGAPGASGGENPAAEASADEVASGDAIPAVPPVSDNRSQAAPDLGTPAAKPEARAMPESTAPPPNIRVGKITLANGNIDFSDFFVKPNYSANLTGMNGSVSKLTPDSPGDVELHGKVDNAGVVEILGQVNPLARSLYLDLQANASDIDLPRLSPYSVKYMGYGIQKGKLSAKVKYKVVDRKLIAENNVVLDQLTFGDKVDSPTATKLPVLFAVSLLKDRNGVIDVNLPISGSLDDPKFSIGGIVLRIILNLIVKAVTAPFSLLAGLGGGHGDDMAYIEFAPGRADLGPDSQSKLQSLSKALTERPGLKLDLAGRADPEPDREALRKLALEREVKAQKLKDTVRSGSAAGAIDDVKIEPGEYDKYLKLAYEAGQFTKPRNVLGFLKDQPPAEMERMLFENIKVDDSGLLELANRRSQMAKDWLVENGKIPGERLFVTASKVGSDGLKAGGKPTRVELSLK